MNNTIYTLLTIFSNIFSNFYNFVKNYCFDPFYSWCKQPKVQFIITQIVLFFVAFVVFISVSGASFDADITLQASYCERFYASFKVLLALIRGIWQAVCSIPGSLGFRIQCSIHLLLVLAPVIAIIIVIFIYIVAIQSAFFIYGILSENPDNLKLKTFIVRFYPHLLVSLFIVICVILYIIFYDPSQQPPFPCTEGSDFMDRLLEPMRNLAGTTQFSACFIFAYTGQNAFGDFVKEHSYQEAVPEPYMEALIALHSDIWAILLFVAGFMLYMLYTILYNFSASSSQVSYKVRRQSFTEIIWETIPALIFCVIAIPSFTLLYSLDEVIEPSLTIKDIGWQWYYSYEYGDYEVHDGLVTNGITFNLQNGDHGMISPNEPLSSGWYSGVKNWWYGDKDTSTLTSREASIKTTQVLQKAQKKALMNCEDLKAKAEDPSLSPRSHYQAQGAFSQCLQSVKDLNECFSEVSKLGVRTAHTPEQTLTGTIGDHIGQSTAKLATDLLKEVAKNGLSKAGDNL